MAAVGVLEILKEKPRLSPVMVSERVGKKPQYIRNILTVLAELNLVRASGRGVYEITLLGEHVLEEVKKNEK